MHADGTGLDHRFHDLDSGGVLAVSPEDSADIGVEYRHVGFERVKLLRDRAMPKGDPLEVARIAGILAAKKTSELIPLCHPLPLTHLDISIEVIDSGARIEATARTKAETGVEMEAMTAVSVSALTLYDMCKAVEKGISIGPLRLLEKSGGKSGHWVRHI